MTGTPLTGRPMLDTFLNDAAKSLEDAGYRLQSDRVQPESSGMRVVTWRNGRIEVRVVWEGQDSWVRLEAWGDSAGPEEERVALRERLDGDGRACLLAALRQRLDAEFD
jgi:hypothetical protein